MENTDDITVTNGGASFSAADDSRTPENEEENDQNIDEADWKPISEAVLMVHDQMEQGIQPCDILERLMPGVGRQLPDDITQAQIWHLLVEILTEPPKRQKLEHISTFDHAIDLIRNSKKIVVLTGAGISVSCGIPDFRSKQGIYAEVKRNYPDLKEPQDMFSMDLFKKDPRLFYSFAKRLFPGQFEPSLSHKFIKILENEDKLLRNYTQNIDTLEQAAGISRIVQCHGSFETASCVSCGHKVGNETIRKDVFSQSVPFCPKCHVGVMKPDIVFFGEDLPKEFHQQMIIDKQDVDLLIIIGSSLKVKPVALIPHSIKPEVPQILIDRQPLPHMNVDIELLGYSDTIIEEICYRLGPPYANICSQEKQTQMDRIEHLPDCQEPSTSTSGPISGPPTKMPRLSSPLRHMTSSAEPAQREMTPEMEKDSLEELKSMYKPKLRNVASALPPNAFYFVPPNRHIFPGAEVIDERAEEIDSVSECDNKSTKSMEPEFLMNGNDSEGSENSESESKSCLF